MKADILASLLAHSETWLMGFHKVFFCRGSSSGPLEGGRVEMFSQSLSFQYEDKGTE